MKKIISTSLAILLGLSVYAQYNPSTTIIQGNVKILDDPTTDYYTEGLLVVDRNILLPASAFNDNDYSTYNQYGEGNILLGRPSGGYSSSTRSILMGSGYFFSASNSILMGNGYSYGNASILMGNGNLSGNSSILMGNGELYGDYSIVMGTANASNLYRSMVAGTVAAYGITDSIVLGEGSVDSIYKSISLSDSRTYISNIYSSLVIGNVSAGGGSNSILVGNITIPSYGDGVFLMGNVRVSDTSYNLMNSFMMGSSLKVTPYFDYSGVDNIFSFGANNTSRVPNSYLIGVGLKTETSDSFAIGTYNAFDPYIPFDEYDSYIQQRDTDPLFVVGNGTSDRNRSNAFTVRRNGNAEVSGEVKATKFVTTNASGGIPMGEFGRSGD